MVSRQKTQAINGSIQQVKGVGPRTADRFKTRNINTLEDALYFFPTRYETIEYVSTIADLVVGQLMGFTAQVLDVSIRRIGYHKTILQILLGDSSGKLLAKWFNFDRKAGLKWFSVGDEVRVSGRLELYKNERQMIHPDIYKNRCEKLDNNFQYSRLLPCYPEIQGISQKSLRSILCQVVTDYAENITDALPQDIRHRYGFPSAADAFRQLHLPSKETDLDDLLLRQTPAHRRVVFEEFFLFQLCLALSWHKRMHKHCIKMTACKNLASIAPKLFGFELTRSQKKVLSEISQDLRSENPMNRLLQGDVGSGKTALAILAAIGAIKSGVQTAILAPTEILARQHFCTIYDVLKQEPNYLKVGFLSSSVKSSKRKEILDRLKSGDLDLLVGTHAIIQERINFRRLGFCIIDEQHRFGVLQRAKMRHKGSDPHVLIMTATPIPRTLALTIYGDLEVSILDEMPPGRRSVKTVVSKEPNPAYEHIRHQVGLGRQAYLVYPLVEESKKSDLLDATRSFLKLQNGAFINMRLGLLHGRMSLEEKEHIMYEFTTGNLDVLVCTTIVEVGLDITNATTMVVEHAERFGLSQLHQLRGRVGRGKIPGTCFLIAHSSSSQDAISRLEIMEQTNDGFLIAQRDMEIRGPGEYLGTRQSGVPSFVFADLVQDADLLALAREEAFNLVKKDPLLTSSVYSKLKQLAWSRWTKRWIGSESPSQNCRFAMETRD